MDGKIKLVIYGQQPQDVSIIRLLKMAEDKNIPVDRLYLLDKGNHVFGEYEWGLQLVDEKFKPLSAICYNESEILLELSKLYDSEGTSVKKISLMTVSDLKKNLEGLPDESLIMVQLPNSNKVEFAVEHWGFVEEIESLYPHLVSSSNDLTYEEDIKDDQPVFIIKGVSCE